MYLVRGKYTQKICVAWVHVLNAASFAVRDVLCTSYYVLCTYLVLVLCTMYLCMMNLSHTLALSHEDAECNSLQRKCRRTQCTCPDTLALSESLFLQKRLSERGCSHVRTCSIGLILRFIDVALSTESLHSTRITDHSLVRGTMYH